MFPTKVARAAGSGASVPVEACQVCGHDKLETVLSLGYMPPVNQMVAVGEVPRQLPWFPTTLLYCGNCELVQLGLAVDPVIIFPPEYPYTSGMTKLLRDNFAELYAKSFEDARARPGRSRRRYWLQRRHADLEISRRAVIASSASSRPMSPRSPMRAAFRRCSAISARRSRAR